MSLMFLQMTRDEERPNNPVYPRESTKDDSFSFQVEPESVERFKKRSSPGLNTGEGHTRPFSEHDHGLRE